MYPPRNQGDRAINLGAVGASTIQNSKPAGSSRMYLLTKKYWNSGIIGMSREDTNATTYVVTLRVRNLHDVLRNEVTRFDIKNENYKFTSLTENQNSNFSLTFQK